MVSANPYNWQQSKVVEILEDIVYIGIMESFKSTRLGFRSRKQIPTVKEMREMEREYTQRTTGQTAWIQAWQEKIWTPARTYQFFSLSSVTQEPDAQTQSR